LPETNETDLQTQSTIYLRERNRQMKLKRQKAEIEPALTRDELVEKELIIRQLSYLLIPMRQSILALPAKLRARIGAEFTHEMVVKAHELVHETLEHLMKLPEAVEPGWLERLEEE
jgi:hypothetical protein